LPSSPVRVAAPFPLGRAGAAGTHGSPPPVGRRWAWAARSATDPWAR
jgi:hypothetical protein